MINTVELFLSMYATSLVFVVICFILKEVFERLSYKRNRKQCEKATKAFDLKYGTFFDLVEKLKSDGVYDSATSSGGYLWEITIMMPESYAYSIDDLCKHWGLEVLEYRPIDSGDFGLFKRITLRRDSLLTMG